MQRTDHSREPLVIVGGTYFELCERPAWNVLYGSGLRAAVALSRRGVPIHLNTCINADSSSALNSIAATFGIQVKIVTTPTAYYFSYLHPLASPYISPLPPTPDKGQLQGQFNISNNNILRYGMLEADAVVHGDYVVYDPQSPMYPELFRSNGSTANHLAIVANFQEVARLSGKKELEEAGAHLRAIEGADVVIVKNGSQGATIFDQQGVHRIPVFKTQQTFSIGSGDIFSATFAYEWMIKKTNSIDAAMAASLATAWYCQTRSVPIPDALPVNFHLGPRLAKHAERKRRIYLAGPFFTLMQLWFMQEVRALLLMQGLEVFSPYHDVGMSGEMIEIAQADLKGLHECDLLFAILDGHDPGTIFEIGYARARGTSVVILIGSVEPVNLTMFKGSGCHIFDDLTSAVYAAGWVE